MSEIQTRPGLQCQTPASVLYLTNSFFFLVEGNKVNSFVYFTWVGKNFGSEKKLGSTKNLSQKIFGPKKFQS